MKSEEVIKGTPEQDLEKAEEEGRQIFEEENFRKFLREIFQKYPQHMDTWLQKIYLILEQEDRNLMLALQIILETLAPDDYEK